MHKDVQTVQPAVHTAFLTTSKACCSTVHKLQHEEVKITSFQVATSMKATKASKALGLDGIALIHLKHLGPGVIHYLTAVINLSISCRIMLGLWKVGCIIPLLKSGKSAKNSKSFRLIAFLSHTVAKLTERLLLPEVQELLPLADHQHGFHLAYRAGLTQIHRNLAAKAASSYTPSIW